MAARARLRDHVLSFAARTTSAPIFTPIHRLVRFTLREGLVPALAWSYVHLACGDRRVRLLARHGVTEVHRSFNAFLSDLDLSGIVPDDLADIETARLAKHIHCWRRRIPSVGELEIYTASEQRELESWLNVGGQIYSVLRKLRKAGWLSRQLRNQTSPYHAYKAELALRRIYGELLPGCAPREMPPQDAFLDLGPLAVRRVSGILPASALRLARELEAEGRLGEVRAESRYFERSWQWPTSGGLEPGETLLLAALAPATTLWGSELEAAVARLREIPELRQAWRALCEIELLVFGAFQRGAPKHPDRDTWMPRWRDDLETSVHLARDFTSVQAGFRAAKPNPNVLG